MTSEVFLETPEGYVSVGFTEKLSFHQSILDINASHSIEDIAAQFKLFDFDTFTDEDLMVAAEVTHWACRTIPFSFMSEQELVIHIALCPHFVDEMNKFKNDEAYARAMSVV